MESRRLVASVALIFSLYLGVVRSPSKYFNSSLLVKPSLKPLSFLESASRNEDMSRNLSGLNVQEPSFILLNSPAPQSEHLT